MSNPSIYIIIGYTDDFPINYPKPGSNVETIVVFFPKTLRLLSKFYEILWWEGWFPSDWLPFCVWVVCGFPPPLYTLNLLCTANIFFASSKIFPHIWSRRQHFSVCPVSLPSTLAKWLKHYKAKTIPRCLVKPNYESHHKDWWEFEVRSAMYRGLSWWLYCV